MRTIVHLQSSEANPYFAKDCNVTCTRNVGGKTSFGYPEAGRQRAGVREGTIDRPGAVAPQHALIG